MLAREIALSFPWLTVHDETHFDALWGLASLIAGETYPLNAAEGFVLGGAILVHDLGCGLAAYPGGLTELQGSTEWRDAAATRFRKEYGRTPSGDDLLSLSPRLMQSSTEEALRSLHAERASELPLVEWPGQGGERLRLLEQGELRSHYGEVIGLVGASHGWDVGHLTERLPARLAAPSWLPADWSVDPVKVACLLRVADAAHMDESRAPAFLRALRQPAGESALHWAFQGKLARASLVGDRLLYTSRTAFACSEAEAWWKCLDALRYVDREIHSVQGLLADRRAVGRPLLLVVNGVLGVGNPLEFARYVRTRDWSPVDARIHVGDVAAMVKRLGGRELYGDNPLVPLRELIQNGADAVRASRALKLKPPEGGEILVRIGGEDGARWIEVEDDGVGMSERVMTDHLLDFTRPFWNTEAAAREHPGLAASSFAPAGRFGMGFFSAFMWGPRVQVASRKHDAGLEDTRVLEFEHGLGARPLLRPLRRGDGFRGPGTRVRVWFEDGRIPEKLISRKRRSPITQARELRGLLAWLAPALDVSLSVVDSSGRKLPAVRANDWRTMSRRSLLLRTSRYGTVHGAPMLVADVVAEGRVLGRATAHHSLDEGALVADGVRVCSLRGISGILLGTVSVVSRDAGVPLASADALRRWASEQARLWTTGLEKEQAEIAPVLDMLGADLGDLKVAKLQDGGFVSLAEARAQIAPAAEFLVVDREIPEAHRDDYPPELVFVARTAYTPWDEDDHRAHGVSYHFARLAAEVWNAPVSAIRTTEWMGPDQDDFELDYVHFRRPST